VTRRDLVVTIPMLLLALWAVRNVAIAPLIGLPVVARCFARDEEQPSSVGRPLVVGAITVLVLAALVMGFEVTQESPYDLATYPTAAMHYVERHGLIGTRLLTTDATAGWVILDHYPEQKVFMDDRYDMYPTSVIYDYFKILEGKPGWDKVLDKYQVETIVWPAKSAFGSLLDESSQWKRVYAKGGDAVWVRAGS
jgi:hypothetical protein